MTKNILSILDINADDLLKLVDYTIYSIDTKPQSLLTGKNIGLFFDRPSTRTRTAFTLAASNLGASVISYQPSELQVTTGETWEDTSRVLSEYLDILVIRGRTTEQASLFVQPDRMGVINALTDEEHPTQTIADLVTIKQRFGRLENIRLLFLGDGGNIATSLLLAGARIPKMELTFITPQKYGFKESVISKATTLAKDSSAKISYHHDPRQLPNEVDVVYTTRWRSMGEEKSDSNWLDDFKGFQVTTALLSKVSNSSTIFLHDLPAERGAEVDFEVLEDKRSVIYQQSRNKFMSAKAILMWCCDIQLNQLMF